MILVSYSYALNYHHGTINYSNGYAINTSVPCSPVDQALGHVLIGMEGTLVYIYGVCIHDLCVERCILFMSA